MDNDQPMVTVNYALTYDGYVYRIGAAELPEVPTSLDLSKWLLQRHRTQNTGVTDPSSIQILHLHKPILRVFNEATRDPDQYTILPPEAKLPSSAIGNEYGAVCLAVELPRKSQT